MQIGRDPAIPVARSARDTRSKSRLAIGLLGAALVATLLLAGMTLALAPRPVPPPMPTQATNFWLTDAGIKQATAFRGTSRLPAAEAWVRQVAANPVALANVPQYGVPLTTAEIELITSRAKSLTDVRRVMDRFAAEHPDAWAGDYVDGGVLTAVLVDPTGSLRDELLGAIATNAPFSVKTARWTLAELTTLKERVLHDFWLSSRYHLLDLGVNVEANLVELQVSSADESAPARILEHFGAGDQLKVTIDGTGVAELPMGRINGIALDAAGRPVAGLAVELESDVPGVNPTSDVGYETASDGTFMIPDVPATGYTVRLYHQVDRDGKPLPHADWIQAGSKRLEVKPGEVSDARIIVS
jgi:hypothetical protein